MSKTQKRRRDRRPNIPMATLSGVQSQDPDAFSRPASVLEQFHADYTHVKRDLRRIGLLAGSFITLLVLLSFIL